MKTKLLFCSLSLLWLTGCTNFLFYPSQQQYLTPDVLGVDYDDLELITQDGLKLHGWHLHASAERKGSLVYLHGNAENVSSHFGNVYWLTDYGYDIYLFDYRGYGQSEGHAELDGIISDSCAMIRYAIENKRSQKLIVIGQSLGASLAIYCVANSADKSDIDTFIAISGFSDYRAVTQDVLARSPLTWALQVPLKYTINNDYSPIEQVAKISPVPLLIMHSKSDTTVEYYHAVDLFTAALAPKKLFDLTGGHNNVFQRRENRQLLLDYLQGMGDLTQ